MFEYMKTTFDSIEYIIMKLVETKQIKTSKLTFEIRRLFCLSQVLLSIIEEVCTYMILTILLSY